MQQFLQWRRLSLLERMEEGHVQKVMSRDKVAETLDPVEFAAWKLLILGLVLDTWPVFPNLLWPTAPGSGATYLLPAEPCWHRWIETD